MAKRVLSARRTRKDEKRREKKREEERKSEERKGEKEMQRLPYNGAPRAHKLRHNVISSSFFNERWQCCAHVLSECPRRSYTSQTHLSFPFFLSLSLSLSFSLFLFHDASFDILPSSSRTCCEPCVALRCQVAVSNVIHLLIEPRRASLLSPFHGDIEISFLWRECVTCAANHHFSITLARYASFVRLPYLHSRITRLSFAGRCIHTSFHEVQFLRIIASMHDLMRSILFHKIEYCIDARIRLFRNWHRSSGWKCYEFQRVEDLNRC